MTVTLKEIDLWQVAPADFETLAQMVQATSPTVDDVHVACKDIWDEDDELVIELEVRLPLRKPVSHHIQGFHADVTGC
jgi:hypothetical protein